MLKSYVYLWLRANGTPYYIGKGSGRRAFISSQHSVHRPLERDRIILQEYESESEAFEAEAFLVEFFGRLDDGSGCLRNHTVGGLGGSRGVKPYLRTERHRQQLRERLKGNRHAVGAGRPASYKPTAGEIAKRSAGIKAAWAAGKYAGRVRKF